VLLAGAGATVVLGIVLARIAVRPSPSKPELEGPNPPIVKSPELQPQVSPKVVQELDGLKSNLQALSQELVQLRRRAELLDERRDVEALVQRFDRSLAMNHP
jgi:hypothetical protein